MIPKKVTAVVPVKAPRGSAAAGVVLKDDLRVVELGSGVMLDVFINVEGRLTTFVSLDGQLIVELRVAGQG